MTQDPFEVSKLQVQKPQLTRKQKKQAAVAGGGVVVANEARGAVKGHYYGQLGRKISTAANGHVPIQHLPVTPGDKITQKTHSPGIHQIPIDTVNRYRNRPTPSKAFPELRRSIRRNGFTSPVHVRVYRNGADLWDGNHRAAVAHDMGLKHIPVSITHINGNKPVPKTALSVANKLKHQRYRRNVLGIAEHAVKKSYGPESDSMISAFGVDHGYEIEKAVSLGGVKSFATDAKKGFSLARGGRSFGAAPGTTGGMLGAKTGNSLGHIGPALKKPKVRLALAGTGVAGAGGIGYGLHRNN